ncbi:MAG TPA: cupin domain-containing protein [Allosphingosinicella sp.]|nr:cupin domain-containing protein [Allosphingosinicella sp.]
MLLIALMLAQAAPSLPVRVPLGEVPLPEAKSVERVIVMRVNFAPGQAMPRHVHSAPVVCLVEHGRFEARIGDAPARTVGVGEVTLEPANVEIGYFRNLSASEPASLVCTFLAGHDDHELARMLPER